MGEDNHFADEFNAALAGKTQYKAIFVPWYWQDEYKIKAPEGFELNDEEQDYLDLHSYDGLTIDHLAWRRVKIVEFSSDEERGKRIFKQEYPFTSEEAFEGSGNLSFIDVEAVRRARKLHGKLNCINSPVVLGVDVARFGDDRSAICIRRGREVLDIVKFYQMDTMSFTGEVVKCIKQYNPMRVFVDVIGVGSGVVDRLHELGYKDMVIAVNVSRTAMIADRFINCRAELWNEVNEWLNQDMEVSLPDSAELQKDLTVCQYKYNSNSRLQIESKESIKKRGAKSPDMADALCLTFYYGQHTETVTSYKKPPSNYNSTLC